MTTSIKNLTPRKAWAPIPHKQWGKDEAAHLLRRAGFSATPDRVNAIHEQGLQATLAQWFTQPSAMPMPKQTAEAEETYARMNALIRNSDDEEEKREMRRLQRMAQNDSYDDYAVRWLDIASRSNFSPQEKYVMFLQDIFVVARAKERHTNRLFEHQNLLRMQGMGEYPTLAKAVSRSPAMIYYLDLHRSRKASPNENFARELFELFTLGEGNYTEQDIKEAARAFTGYRIKENAFFMAKRDHDDSPKSIFGETGNFSGDDVIDLVYRQPEAQSFVPREMVLFYLTDRNLPDDFYRELGRLWHAHNYDMAYLLQKFFSSRAFYAPEFRGNLIKSPTQYYIGLCQDMNLDVCPLPGMVLNQLNAMGQPFYNPPNVRGWVGGRHWINATTLSARRSLAKRLFSPIDESELNADDVLRLSAAREAGRGRFQVTEDRLRTIAAENPEYIVHHFCKFFLPVWPTQSYRDQLVRHLQKPNQKKELLVKEVLLAILQSPQYQLC